MYGSWTEYAWYCGQILEDSFETYKTILRRIFTKKSQNVSTPKDDFESRFYDLTQKLYTVETFYMSQMNDKEFVHNTAYSVQLSYMPVTPLK